MGGSCPRWPTSHGNLSQACRAMGRECFSPVAGLQGKGKREKAKGIQLAVHRRVVGWQLSAGGTSKMGATEDAEVHNGTSACE